MFEADMSGFTFVFSKDACIKTCIYFAIMYFAVILFNTFTISRYKLIDLINANKKNEKVKIKNPIISLMVLAVGVTILGWGYWKVTGGIGSLNDISKLMPPIIAGIIGTILIFWSLAGFVLRIVKSMKKVYLKGTNMFVLRQINNKVNTMVASMSVICIMLFLTICILSSGLALRDIMTKELKEVTPVDLNLYKTANLQDTYTRYGKEQKSTEEAKEDSIYPISYTLKTNGYDMNNLKDIVEVTIYASNNLTLENFFGDKLAEVKAQFSMLKYNTAEEIIKISDYNKIAKLYGNEQYELKNDEYIVICNFDSMTNLRNKALAGGNILNIAGKNYKSKYNECKDGFILLSTNRTNTGLIVVPDDCNLTEDIKESHLLVANYNAKTEEERERIENTLTSSKSEIIDNIIHKGINLDGLTKISITESSVGIATIIVFIAIYLGIVFLIASAAILALKQLTESSDNKQRYTILRKIGCDEKMINKSLFRQIGIFFMLPLALAIVHSVFGIKFAMTIMSEVASSQELLPSIIATVVIFGTIYGAYFIATYMGSKNIIKEDQ